MLGDKNEADLMGKVRKKCASTGHVFEDAKFPDLAKLIAADAQMFGNHPYQWLATMRVEIVDHDHPTISQTGVHQSLDMLGNIFVVACLFDCRHDESTSDNIPIPC